MSAADPATKADITRLDARLDSLDRKIDAVDARLSSEIRAVGVVVERVDSKLDAVIEGLVSTRQELKADMKAMEERLSLRITILEEAVRETSVRVGVLEREVADLRRCFEARDGKVEDLERRVAVLELRLGVDPRKSQKP